MVVLTSVTHRKWIGQGKKLIYRSGFEYNSHSNQSLMIMYFSSYIKLTYHKALMLCVQISTSKRGPGYWKLEMRITNEHSRKELETSNKSAIDNNFYPVSKLLTMLLSVIKRRMFLCTHVFRHTPHNICPSRMVHYSHQYHSQTEY